LEIEDEVWDGAINSQKEYRRVLLLGEKSEDGSENGENKEDESDDRKEVKPETEVVVFERGKEAKSVHL